MTTNAPTPSLSKPKFSGRPGQYWRVCTSPPSKNLGFSILELMISMGIGLIISAAVILIFLSNQEMYRQNDNLARLQENARYGFEIMGRHIREAGGIPCGSNLNMANVLTGADTQWWSNWTGGLQGFEGTDNTFPQAIGTNVGDRVAGTDAITILSGSISPAVRITGHDSAANILELETAGATETGTVLMACDYNQAAIFQVSAATATDRNIEHNISVGTPSNCSAGLGFPTDCAATPGTPKTFSNNGFVTPLSATAWYLGTNNRGGRSLFRLALETTGTTAAPLVEEVAEGIVDLQIEYLEQDISGALPNDYVDATTVTDWENVVAARLVVTLETLEPIAGGNPLVRRWYTIFALRNRAT